MIVAGPALATLLTACVPSVSPDTMRAIVSVESDGNPYAVNDNTARRSYAPDTLEGAKALLAQFVGHDLDVGIAQVNSSNFRSYDVTAAEMLDPCRSLQVGSAILAVDYRASAARFPDHREALAAAIGAYNSGSIYAGEGYVRQVVAAATRAPAVPSIAILTGHVRFLYRRSLPIAPYFARIS